MEQKQLDGEGTIKKCKKCGKDFTDIYHPYSHKLCEYCGHEKEEEFREQQNAWALPIW
jgi:uncharacterized OB-fold protein